MMLRSAAVPPPTTLDAPVSTTPLWLLPRPVAPAALVPIKLPATMLAEPLRNTPLPAFAMIVLPRILSPLPE